ncbi:MAG: 3-oxocholest-4-en-26-oate---CoA ligase, partial [Actinomycetota bacterium]|nr:3-oxocholest-4-en-26-oate---CoA ligase [Actinomycetota bacterium]
MEFNLADLFERVADTVPDRPALVAGNRRLTYAQLDERANRAGHALLDAGARTGQHVGIHAQNRAEWVEAMLGCFKARLVPVNVNYRYVVDELRYLFDNADLVALFFEAQFGPRIAPVLPQLEQLRYLVRIADGTDDADSAIAAVEYEQALAAASPRRDFGPRSSDDHYILYTGGTTGMPKGVVWRQENIFFGAMGGGNYGGPGIETPEAIAQSVTPAPAVTLALAPLMHGNAQWTMFNAFFGGGTVVLSTGRFDPDEIWKLIAAEGVNVLSLVGDAMARPLVDALRGAPAPESLFAIVSGGAILSATIKTQIHEVMPQVLVLDSFGASETGANGVVESTASGPRFHMQESTIVIGDDYRPVAPGATGWLARRGHVPVGYYKDETKTAATFVEVDGQRWAIPGDLAVLEA